MNCRECSKEVVKIWTGRHVMRKRGKGERIYVDAEGKQVSRGRCHVCMIAYQRSCMSPPPRRFEGRNRITKRLCIKCKKSLPESRYFRHAHCDPKTAFDDLTEMYEYVG